MFFRKIRIFSRESSRLEAELRRVEKCASGGGEIRERARLASAAHARERRLANAELAHTTKELFRANSKFKQTCFKFLAVSRSKRRQHTLTREGACRRHHTRALDKKVVCHVYLEA